MRREVARDQRDCAEYARHESKRHRIGGSDAVQQPTHEARQCERRDHTDACSGQGRRHSLPHNESQYARRLRAKRDANSNLVSAPRDRIAHHAIDADSRQDDRDRRECPEQNQIEA